MQTPYANPLCLRLSHVFSRENSHWACKRCGRSWEDIMEQEQYPVAQSPDEQWELPRC